jgi:hypothetical protein
MFCGVFTFGLKEEICSLAEEQQINLVVGNWWFEFGSWWQATCHLPLVFDFQPRRSRGPTV